MCMTDKTVDYTICKGENMNILKKFCNRIFIDGLGGMALGLFATLIVGTIIQQIGKFVEGNIGDTIIMVGKIAATLMGAGIGCGVAYKFKESPLVVLSAATAGMVGAYAVRILEGKIIIDGGIQLLGYGEPLGAFIAAYVAIEVGHLISGKTGIDILLTPLVCIGVGSVVGVVVGPPISGFMKQLGDLINWATTNNPFVMGVIVSVVMGMVLTLPISSAAIGVVLQLSGIAAGAATVGCCANMVGFAVASYRENKTSGLIAQGLGTSMLQVPNIVKKPVIWLPVIITSAILGPVSTILFGMMNDPMGSGMGTSGLVGPIQTYNTMIASEDATIVLIKIILIQFVLPAIITLGISEFFRKKGIIKNGDMKLDI